MVPAEDVCVGVVVAVALVVVVVAVDVVILVVVVVGGWVVVVNCSILSPPNTHTAMGLAGKTTDPMRIGSD